MGLEQHYQTLGLEPGASAAAIKQAYRDLAKVWHPDRFGNDDRLRDKAAEKLREINVAYQALRDRGGSAPEPSARPQPKVEPTPQPKPRPQPIVKQPVARQPASPAPPAVGQRSAARPGSRSRGWLLVLLAVLVGAGVFALVKLRGGSQDAKQVAQPPPTPPPTPPPPTPKPPPTAGHFTLGSTEAEVLAAMGPPDKKFPMDGVIWFWDIDQVHFRNGRVDTWRQSFDRRLKVKLEPTDAAAAERARTRGYIELGSTVDEVIGVQGTPDEILYIIGTRWSYGMSNLTFIDGRVSGWWQSATGPQLRLAPGAPDMQ